MKHFWFEKYINNYWTIYFGCIDNFQIGIVLGVSNKIYLGNFVMGIDKY